jgi:aconitate hydratase
VLAESFERIHRSNLIGMGVLPLQLPDGETAESLGFTGEETIEVGDLADGEAKSVEVTVRRPSADPAASGGEAEEAGGTFAFEARVRLDTPNEVKYFQNGGILHRVLRDLRG